MVEVFDFKNEAKKLAPKEFSGIKPKNHFKSLLVIVVALAIIALPAYRFKSFFAKQSTTTVNNQDLSTISQQLISYSVLKNPANLPIVYAKSYILMDADNGDILVEKNADQKVPIASITKMITALTALELFKTDQVLTVSQPAASTEGSIMGLTEGEKITFDSLMKGMLIISGNDAAHAIADSYTAKPGDYQGFVDKMNEFAAKWHLANSSFKDPAGLDDEGLSTPRELGQVARLLINNDYLAKIVGTDLETVTSSDGAIIHNLKNTNSLELKTSPLYMNTATGIKTGFTDAAGHCLVSSVTINDHRYIGVVMNTTEYSVTAAPSEMRDLFLWAEENIKIQSY